MKTLLCACVVCLAPLVNIVAEEFPAPEAVAPKTADWILGTWTFDEHYTLQKVGTAARDVATDDAPALTSTLVEKMRGATIAVTRDQLTMNREGSSKTDKYTIEPGASDEEVSLKQANGDVITFHRDGDRLWTSANTTGGELFFFKKNP